MACPLATALSQYLNDIRRICFSKGVGGLKWLAVIFRKLDVDNSHTISFDEFVLGLRKFGVTMTEEQLMEIFTSMDKDCSGQIDFYEFCSSLRPPLSPARMRAINFVFDHLDVNCDNVIETEDLVGSYLKASKHWLLNGKYAAYAKLHPKYVSGDWTLEQVVSNFLRTFDNPSDPDGSVTREEFIDYYAGVSHNYDEDEYFFLALGKSWNVKLLSVDNKK